MKYIRDNKVMLLKYLSVVVSNILLYILVSFYFRNVENNFLILFVVVAIFDYIIFNYKDKIKYNYLLDIICCIFGKTCESRGCCIIVDCLLYYI